jgi:hypothetical protein
VQPRDDLIGFNSEGKAKVWLNSQPQFSYRDYDQPDCYFDNSYSLSKRIKILYELFERKTLDTFLPFVIKDSLF